jgi:hypothetical protein
MPNFMPRAMRLLPHRSWSGPGSTSNSLITSTGQKSTDLIASDRRTGAKIALEAKTRSRKGVYHSEDGKECGNDWQWVRKKIREATKQRSPDLPFVIFIDVNAPTRPDLAVFSKPWTVDLKEAILQTNRNPSEDNPDLYSLIVATNFAHHYALDDAMSPHGEFHLVKPNHPAIPINDASTSEILKTIERYDRIPGQM